MNWMIFIEQLKITGTKLKDAISIVTELKKKVEESYKVDEESGDRRVIEKEIESLENMYNNVVNIMIPSTNNRINNLSRNIQILENNERKKAEAEKLKAQRNNRRT